MVIDELHRNENRADVDFPVDKTSKLLKFDKSLRSKWHKNEVKFRKDVKEAYLNNKHPGPKPKSEHKMFMSAFARRSFMVPNNKNESVDARLPKLKR